jgi:hypothetical protein
VEKGLQKRRKGTPNPNGVEPEFRGGAGRLTGNPAIGNVGVENTTKDTNDRRRTTEHRGVIASASLI